MIVMTCETLAGQQGFYVKIERVTGLKRTSLYEIRLGPNMAFDTMTAMGYAIGASGLGRLYDLPETSENT